MQKIPSFVLVNFSPDTVVRVFNTANHENKVEAGKWTCPLSLQKLQWLITGLDAKLVTNERNKAEEIWTHMKHFLCIHKYLQQEHLQPCFANNKSSSSRLSASLSIRKVHWRPFETRIFDTSFVLRFISSAKLLLVLRLLPMIVLYNRPLRFPYGWHSTFDFLSMHGNIQTINHHQLPNCPPNHQPHIRRIQSKTQ